MSSPNSSPALSSPSAGRWTGFSLSLIVMVCIGLIGLSGYVKYELDRTESNLTSPDFQLSPEQQSVDKIRRDLGYGGFLAIAQNFVATHDPAILPELKVHLKQANEGLEHLSSKTSAETRQDLQAILATFAAALQKAEKSTAVAAPPAPSVPEFTSTDLLPLYAALPVLDARIANAVASARLAEQNDLQEWATYLTIICWVSLIVASALAAGIFLVLRDRNSAPMRALAQSVKNMARGDMRTAIWGMERQDAIGELARSVDMARFHFSQLPDMSLMSEQGPVRIRFEGNTRSLFEAMMRVIARDSEVVHAQAGSLSEAVQKQQETLDHVIERVEAVLQNVEKRAVTGDHQVRQALLGMLGSAESLKNAQEHAADQLNRIIPFLQERTQSISEITQLTGKQVASALQSLQLTERTLKTTAAQSESTIQKFTTTADTLGERMFGAINLLQASGKVLAEISQGSKGRFDDVIERITKVISPAEKSTPFGAVDTDVAGRLEEAVSALETAHEKLQGLLAEQSETTRAHIDLLTTQSSSLLTQASASSQTLSAAADRLRDEQAKLAGLIETMGLASDAGEDGEARSVYDIKESFVGLEQRIGVLQSQMATLLLQTAQSEEKPEGEADQMRDHWYQMAAQIEATRSNLAQVIQQQADRVEAHFANLSKVAGVASVEHDFARDTQQQMEQQTLILNELVATLGLLDTHMQEIRSQVAAKQRAG